MSYSSHPCNQSSWAKETTTQDSDSESLSAALTGSGVRTDTEFSMNSEPDSLAGNNFPGHSYTSQYQNAGQLLHDREVVIPPNYTAPAAVRRICREKTGTDWQTVFDVIKYGEDNACRMDFSGSDCRHEPKTESRFNVVDSDGKPSKDVDMFA
ncbi:uncharacterized protein HD556DRAFT_1305978 [Suillus plorans]|uniref:Uncharacterized protein n=1 Tax=Suillus plorans TaxID=116603 RepID=A0A9P7J0R2_9AGAM|nr:uncharacterized protein HD556DRAFT_1305978 [Suillus plorans]KAG1798515.1 hypothetical protein HD556DRAFT_1305978 [Suillus plorans]